jgi:hypothetical protein
MLRLALAQKGLAEHPHTDQQSSEKLEKYEESYRSALPDSRMVLENLEGSINVHTDKIDRGRGHFARNILSGVSSIRVSCSRLS